MVNPYSVLGVKVSDDYKVKKRRYRALCRLYHPDNKVTGDRAKFDEVQESWKLICSNNIEPVVKRAKWHHKGLFKIVKEA